MSATAYPDMRSAVTALQAQLSALNLEVWELRKECKRIIEPPLVQADEVKRLAKEVHALSTEFTRMRADCAAASRVVQEIQGLHDAIRVLFIRMRAVEQSNETTELNVAMCMNREVPEGANQIDAWRL